jgi:hypothetical protein
MTQVQGEVAQFRCPRCGGLMRKPTGSTLYWHADNNHPRCNITNIVDIVQEIQQQTAEPPGPPPASPRARNRRGK